MKLVDILARELKDWPEGFSEKAGQCINGRLHGYSGTGHPNLELTHRTFTLCSDFRNDTVTRAEWQAAVDVLNAPKVVEWNGDGLPPTGTICELQHMSWNADRWEKRKILYAGSRYLVTTDPDSAGELGSYIWEVQFRPIRTAEQVAAENRENAAAELFYAVMNHPASSWSHLQGDRKEHYRGLVDSGWKKEPKPCGS